MSNDAVPRAQRQRLALADRVQRIQVTLWSRRRFGLGTKLSALRVQIGHWKFQHFNKKQRSALSFKIGEERLD